VKIKQIFLAGAVGLGLIGIRSSAWAGGSHTFSVSDVQGTYAETFSGFVVGGGTRPTTISPIPFSIGTSFPENGTGTMIADGAGGFQATVVSITGGTLCAGTLAGGPAVDGGDGIPTGYTVNSDGTGTSRGVFTPFPAPATLPPQLVYACPPAGGHQDEYFIISGHEQISFISIDSDVTLTGTATRQRGGF
jgi:hypothetical protein